jgi:hypothetical protein
MASVASVDCVSLTLTESTLGSAGVNVEMCPLCGQKSSFAVDGRRLRASGLPCARDAGPARHGARPAQGARPT